MEQARQTTQDSLLTQALDALFTSSARVAVLRIFMLDPTREYYQRQIEGATGLPIRAIQRELERLTAAGLVYRRVEGNRIYYQADIQFPLFPELRGLVLKTSSTEDRLRGELAMHESVRLMLWHEQEGRVLLVTNDGTMPLHLSIESGMPVSVMSVDDFLTQLTERSMGLTPFLTQAVDLLGRRDDVLWRRIEQAGFEVKKGRGVP